MPSTDLNEIEEQTIIAFDPAGADGGTIVAARLTHHPNRDIVDASIAVVHDGMLRSVHATARAGGRDVDADIAIGPLAFTIDPAAADAIVVSVDGPGLIGALRFRPWTGPAATLEWEEPAPFPASIEDHRHPGDTGGELRTSDGRAIAVPPLGIGWRRAGAVTAADLIHPLARAPLTELPRRFAWDLAIVPEGAGDGGADDGLPTIVVERDTDDEATLVPRWRRGTRWIEAATVAADPGDEFVLEVLAWMPLNALGFDHPHWTPGRWHDEIAFGSEERSIADLDPTDVRNLRALSVVRVSDGDGEPVGVGLVDLVAYGDHPGLELEGFSPGWSG